jgi:hypothetical protein
VWFDNSVGVIVGHSTTACLLNQVNNIHSSASLGCLSWLAYKTVGHRPTTLEFSALGSRFGPSPMFVYPFQRKKPDGIAKSFGEVAKPLTVYNVCERSDLRV